MHAPMPMSTTPAEIKCALLLDNLDAVSDFGARQQAVQRIEGMLVEMRAQFPANAVEVTSPESDIVNMVVTAYLNHARTSADQDQQNYFLDRANGVLMHEANGYRQYDMNDVVMAAIPLLDTETVNVRQATLVRNLANVALKPLSKEAKDGLTKVAQRFEGQDADDVDLKEPMEGFEPLDAQSLVEDIALLIDDKATLYAVTPAQALQNV